MLHVLVLPIFLNIYGNIMRGCILLHSRLSYGGIAATKLVLIIRNYSLLKRLFELYAFICGLLGRPSAGANAPGIEAVG